MSNIVARNVLKRLGTFAAVMLMLGTSSLSSAQTSEDGDGERDRRERRRERRRDGDERGERPKLRVEVRDLKLRLESLEQMLQALHENAEAANSSFDSELAEVKSRTSSLEAATAYKTTSKMDNQSALAEEVREAQPISLSRDATSGTWNRNWGLVFTLSGVSSGAPVLSTETGGGVAGAYFLGANTQVRIGADLTRIHDPERVKRTTVLDGDGGETVSFEVEPDSGDTAYGADVFADYLMRASNNEVAPYFGLGAGIQYDRVSGTINDDFTTEDLEVQNEVLNQDLSFALRGILGADWRVHDSISLFAEYALSLTVLRIDEDVATTTERVLVDGTEVAGQVTRTESSNTAWLPLETGVGHSGRIGLLFHF